MNIEVRLNVNVPMSPYCGDCIRQEIDKNGYKFCSLFNRFLAVNSKEKFIKCRECYNALYEAVLEE